MKIALIGGVRSHAIRYGVVTFLGVAAGYFIWGGDARPPKTPETDATASPAKTQVEANEWTCSMHPQIRQPDPGLCPICNMDLIPASQLEDGGQEESPRRFSTSEAAAKLMEIRTAPVERRFVEAQVRMVGKIAYDETRLATITAWVPGRIERMYADYTGIVVRKGDHMVDLYSPDLIAAKEELRRARKALSDLPTNAPPALRDMAESALDAVRARLRRWGVTSGQIEEAERAGAANDRITIYAPIGGTVIERQGQEGAYVDTGSPIYTIAGLDRVWVNLDAYESDLPWIHFGQIAEFSVESYPGEVFEGKIAFIAPTLDERTRTVDVRVNVENEDGHLKPGMLVRAVVKARVATQGRVMDPGLAGKWISPMHPEVVKDGPGTCDVCGMDLVPAEELGYVALDADDDAKPLVIPASAPLVTGKRAVVYVEVRGADRPTFEGREVVLGPKAGDFYIVEEGLDEGERVVMEGSFKIDSALEVAARPSMMSMPGGGLIAGNAQDALAIQEGVREVFDAYAAVGEALAYDDYANAQNLLPRLTQALGELPGDAAVIETLREQAAGLRRARKGISELRTAFKPLSYALHDVIQAKGIAPGDPVYWVHCPMAFDDEGAHWLQNGAEVHNLYFGDEMFVCGMVQEQLAEAADKGGMSAAGHEGHAHAGH